MQGSNIYSVLLDFTEKTNIDVLVLGMPNSTCLRADNTNFVCYQTTCISPALLVLCFSSALCELSCRGSSQCTHATQCVLL